MRQHLTAVNAAAEISGARTEGAEVGAAALVFEPGATSPGDYLFRIGSAGSTGLVLQTVLPPAWMTRIMSSSAGLSNVSLLGRPKPI